MIRIRLFTVFVLMVISIFSSAKDIDHQAMHENISNLYQLSFIPTETSIEAIPIRIIEPSWQKVLVLRAEVLPKWAKEHVARDKDRNMRNSWQIIEDIDGDGSLEKVLVGVYQNRSGEVGRFLLILKEHKEQADNQWTKVFLKQEHDHSAQYSEIHWDTKKRRLTWGVCYPCDSVTWVHWDGKRYITSYPKFE